MKTANIINIIKNAITANTTPVKIDNAIDRCSKKMEELSAQYPHCTGMVFMGGLQEVKASHFQSLEHVICHDGSSMESCINEAAKRILENGGIYNFDLNSIYYMPVAGKAIDITKQVRYVLFKETNNETYNKNFCKLMTAREHMQNLPGSSAILYVDGLKQSETRHLNECIQHKAISVRGAIKSAIKDIKKSGYGYTGTILFIEKNGNVVDITGEVNSEMVPAAC